MIHIILFLAITGFLLLGLFWLVQWIKKNRFRISLNRMPSGREMVILSLIWRIVKTLLFRVLLRR